MKEIELKPCPFCGSKAMITASIKKGYAKSVLCLGCLSEHMFAFPFHKFKTNKELHEAIAEKWNRREI